jgi:phosphoglycerate dehydrogenase-like enzyme
MFQDPDVRRQLSDGYEIHDFHDWKTYDPATLLARMRSVDMAIIGRASPRFPVELASDLGRLRYVCHCYGTIKPYIPKELVSAGLIVSNWGDAVESVAEGAMAMLFCLLKQLVTLNQFAKTGKDLRIYQEYRCSLRDLNVGLYGFGPIGRHMGRMLDAFGAKVAIYDPYAKDVPGHVRRCDSLRDLFASCQAISIHCGLNDQTKNSVTRDLLDLLPQGGIVINTARGHIVDEVALAGLVAEGRLLAGLDVIADEQKWDWAGSPLAPYPGTILTLHNIGGGKGFPPDKQPKPQLPNFARHNLVAFRTGQPLVNVVTAAEYDLKT